MKIGEQKKLALIQRYNDLTHKSHNNQTSTNNQSQSQGQMERVNQVQAEGRSNGGNKNTMSKDDRKLEKIMERKRRKNAARERKMMPFSRRNLA